ncbi:nuclear transport factor 2 family protein [Kordiimonas marina]|uniref:nuclear transport factor 2 family protein n=1 Tax=Kordiimonas marina TaxID=2872312 RepID=UPI001FF5A758|nr:nuclear transport factor 2 family protein [Kordiimonas marina]MCJ9429176.1 nuclear transport factor 2 family protein [Kordiimonas marina]
MTSKANLERWYDFVKAKDPSALDALLADDVTFYSPVVHTPQRGKMITSLYLGAAANVLGGDNFRYVGEYLSGDGAVIEFNTVIDGIEIDGIDMITWNTDGKITDFKVMVRPLKAVNKLHEMMAAMLAQFQKR